MPIVDVLEDLLRLAHTLAEPRLDLAILAEGNVSARADGETIWVKGSGQAMGSMLVDGFSKVHLGSVESMLQETFVSDEAIRAALDQARLEGPSPSTETFMHAVLLNLPGARFVGHVHPSPLLSILCLEGAADYAAKRLFPDEIVCCGRASGFVPYVAPGLPLALAIQAEIERFRAGHGVDPKTIWLQNHGLIAVGKTAREVEAACLMSAKAARVLLGAIHAGREIRWLTDEEIAYIDHWPDEQARQQAIWRS